MYDYDSLWDYDISNDIIEGNIERLEIEIAKGWKINEPLKKYAFQGIWKFPVMLAIQYNNMNSIAFLVDHGALLDHKSNHKHSYFDSELSTYGEFNVSFQKFLEEPNRYIHGIFTDEFLVARY